MVDQIESCSPNTLVQCRICHDEDEDLNMDTPCSCSGTLQYAHRICVQRWCNEKGDTTCEICQQQFKGYTAPQAPLFHYRGNWEIPRVGFNNHQFIALFHANHEFLDFNFEYSAPSTRSRVFIRIVAIISGNNISEKAYEDGRTMVESKTADLRSQIRRKGDTNQASSIRNPWQQSDQTQSHSNHETQLKQSRDVALATAAKFIMLNIFVAGTDTSTYTLEWAMAELMHNPEIMSKVQNELEQVVGKGIPVEETDIAKLPYMQAVIKETFRVHPPVPLLLPRKAETDVEIGDYIIPKDAQVLVNAWVIGRDPSKWENPNAFVPERFFNSEIDFKGHHFELIPFGSGRRICPGLPLAIRMLPLMLGSLVNCFDWRLEDGLNVDDLNKEDEYGITLEKSQPVRIVPIKLTKQ
ncbi:unnamed protein product [Vicia faba]|uniref:RING-CH-type domain-containing protein n=1 Tax=Vicia faba TaxID=3906 RepID=A0AAV1A9T3_VICFA|nr:unnamed protein product [Vicia faba]